MSEAMQEAVAGSAYIEEKTSLARVAEQDVSLEERARLVHVNVSADIGYSKRLDNTTRLLDNDHTRNQHGAGVSANLDFYDGGRYKSRLSAAGNRLAMARYSLAATRNEVIAKAAFAYIDVYRYRLLLTFNQELRAEYAKLAQHVEKRVKSGDTPSYELDQILLAKNEVELNQQRLMQKLFEAEENYLAELGRSPAKLDKPVGPPNALFTGKSDGDWQALASASHPRLREQQKHLEELQAKIEEARSSNMPTAGIEVSHRWDEGIEGIKGSRQDTKALLKVNWQLYGQDRGAQVGRAMAELDAAQARLNYLKADVLRGVRIASTNRASSLAALEIHRSDLERIKALLKSSNQRLALEAGSADNVQGVLKVLRQYQTAQTGFLNATYDAQRYSYQLLHAAGHIGQALPF